MHYLKNKWSLFPSILLLFFLFACSDSSEEQLEPEKPNKPNITVEAELTLHSEKLVLFSEKSSNKFLFTSNVEWTAKPAKNTDWISITPSSGEAGKQISIEVVVEANLTNDSRSSFFTIKAGDKKEDVVVKQKQKDAIILSENNYKISSSSSTISVELKTNIDYQIEIPEENKNWISHVPQISRELTNYTESFLIEQNLEDHSRSGQVIFKSNGVTETLYIEQEAYDIGEYSSTDYSKDGEYITLQKATRGNGVDIVLLGDGYVDIHMKENGLYEQDMRELMEYFFSVEPTKSYREYFNIYTVKVVSQHGKFGVPYNTALEVLFDEASWTTRIEGNHDRCRWYAEKAPIKNINNTAVSIVANHKIYKGTCFMYSSGATLAYFTKAQGQEGTIPYYRGIFLHEMLGHGFGRLADEYYDQWAGHIPAEDIDNLTHWQNDFGLSFYPNVSLTNNPSELSWKHFIGHSKYPYVGIHEGGYYAQEGVWRSEVTSCMNNNDPYFNAISREKIVQRIKKEAGEDYSWNEFIAKDKYEPFTQVRARRSGDITYQHTPPVMLLGSPRKMK